MAELPTGTITFLFTDIEGSTQLLRRLGGQDYRRVQDDHGRILRSAIAAEDGVEVRTEGDSFFAVFRTPESALRAAVNAQRHLFLTAWAHGIALRVRMGLHTGEGVLGGGADYVGLDVNRAARIAAAGHGGQVLLSQATLSLVEHVLPPGVSVRDLGQHRLKDIEHPEHLHDLVIDGFRSDFPALKSMEARPTNLPVQRTSFVGRERELAEVGDLLVRTRLLTLTGTGGTGKTRLALKVAANQLERFQDGVFLVGLSSVTDPKLVLSEIATVLRVREVPDGDPADTLADYLRERNLLIVLDNMEQLVRAAPGVARLLDAAPRLKLLVTSRVPLRLSGEQEYSVQPLPLPRQDQIEDVERLAECESVALFLERAAAVRPGFRMTPQTAAAVASISARLDGLPLALELAASRVKVLSPIELAERLDERLPLLTGGAQDLPERQRTLRGAIQWSFDLLSPDEQRLFALLAVFSGGWTLDAAESICGPSLNKGIIEGLESLVDIGLVQQREAEDGGNRFRMLETIEEFAGECLAQSSEHDVTCRRHAEYFRDLAEEAEPHLTGEHRISWLQIFEREHDNVRAALDWAEREDVDVGLRTASALWRFWQLRGHLREARERLERLTALPREGGRDVVRARALGALGGVSYWQSDFDRTRPAYEEAAEIAREVGDPRLLAYSLYDLSFVYIIMEQDFDRAEAIMHEALTHAIHTDRFITGELWTGVGYLAALRNDLPAAVESIERGTAIHRASGENLSVAGNLVALAGFEYFSGGDLEKARDKINEAVGMMANAESPIMFATVLFPLAVLANVDGRHRRAARLLGASERMHEITGGGPPPVAMAHFGDPAAIAREALGDADYEKAYSEGLEMTVHEVVEYAVEDID